MKLKVVSEHVEPWNDGSKFRHILVRVYAHPSGFRCKTVAPVQERKDLDGRLGRLTRTASDHSALARFDKWEAANG